MISDERLAQITRFSLDGGADPISMGMFEELLTEREQLVAIANSFDEAMKYSIVSQGYVDNMRLGIKALKAWK